jgi:hypothetical protein
MKLINEVSSLMFEAPFYEARTDGCLPHSIENQVPGRTYVEGNGI